MKPSNNKNIRELLPIAISAAALLVSGGVAFGATATEASVAGDRLDHLVEQIDTRFDRLDSRIDKLIAELMDDAEG